MNIFKFPNNAISFFDKAKKDVLSIDFLFIAFVDGEKTGAIVIVDSSVGEKNQVVGFVEMDWTDSYFMVPVMFSAQVKIVDSQNDLCFQVEIDRAYRHELSTSDLIRKISHSDASTHFKKYNELFGKHDNVLDQYSPIVDAAREFGFEEEDVSLVPMPGVVDDVETTTKDSEYAMRIVQSFLADALRSMLVCSFVEHVESPIRAAMILLASSYLGLNHAEVIYKVINSIIDEPEIDCAPDENSITDMIELLHLYQIENPWRLANPHSPYAEIEKIMDSLSGELPNIGIADCKTIYSGLSQLLNERKEQLESLLLDDEKMSGEILSVPVKSIRPLTRATSIGSFSIN